MESYIKKFRFFTTYLMQIILVGVIIYDWYSEQSNPKEQIKISVQFLK